MAVAKVDELTRQLEDVQTGRGHSQPASPASMELDKLRAELLVSNVVTFVKPKTFDAFLFATLQSGIATLCFSVVI